MQTQITRPISSGAEPVLHNQPGNPSKLLFIIGHEDTIGGQSMGSDQHVVGSDRRAPSFQFRPDIPVMPVGIECKRKYLDLLQELFDSPAEHGRVLLDRSVSEFGGDDDAGAMTLASFHVIYPGGNPASRVFNEVGKDVCVEQKPRH